MLDITPQLGAITGLPFEFAPVKAIKPLGTAPAPDDIILEMAEEVRLALVGVGL